MSRTLVVLVWYLCIGGGAGYYSIYETFNPSNFFDNFDFFTVSISATFTGTIFSLTGRLGSGPYTWICGLR